MKQLIDYILLEELGISNEVIKITSMIKNEIANDYIQNNNNPENLRWLHLSSNESVSVFKNALTVKFKSTEIIINYYVINRDICEDSTVRKFINTYNSKFDLKTNKLILFLIADKKKIYWNVCSDTLQHEIEHWYQQYRKGNELIKFNHLKKYNNHLELINSDNPFKHNIGLIYYYSEKFEHDAIMNGLYNKIMEVNSISFVEKPENILKEFLHYKNIKAIQQIIHLIETDNKIKNVYFNILKDMNKNFDSFIKLAKHTVLMYIKGFGRTLYKTKKDINSKFENFII